MNRLFVWASVLGLFITLAVRVAAQDDDYIRIYTLIHDADALANSNDSNRALAKYIEAQTALHKFQRMYPDWNANVVAFRLKYLADHIADETAKVPSRISPESIPSGATNAVGSATTAPAAVSNDVQNQLDRLELQVRQLQADKMTLESKLKEALSAQPAVADPRELAKAEDRIRSLEKENSLLKVTLDQQKGKGSGIADTNATARLQQQLADANMTLKTARNEVKALALEREALKSRMESMIPASWNATNLDAAQKALEASNRKLAEQAALASRLGAERETLQERLKSLAADAGAAAALRAENAVLKKQLADLRSVSPAISTNSSRQLAEAQARVASLESDNELLRLSKIALEDRVKQLSVAASTNAVPVAAAPPVEESARVKELERQQADLQKKLEAAQKELYGKRSKNAAARIDELTGELDILRTRLGVFEAQQVPYSPEELALFNRPEPALTDGEIKAGQKSVRELPAGSAALVAEAQRDFAGRRFDSAEQKYLQVLKKDDKNVSTLANLATIQLEMNHLDDAEKHIKAALAEAPDDAYSLCILGNLRFRQGKYDEALDALSRGARVDPRNAQIQNFLGLTLSEKGMRGPAETALRKAIQLDPGYSEAHYNLAVIYLTQKPPLPELARWHYEKAIAAGFPHNADFEKTLDQVKARASQ